MDNYILTCFHHGETIKADPELSYKDGGDLVQITSDSQLLKFVKELKDGNEFDVYVFHDIDEDLEVVKNVVPLLVGPNSNDEIDIGSDGNRNRSLNEDLNGDESNFPSIESDLNSENISDVDGSDIDEELRG
ncbi:hypothetical protein FXO37_01822 [Capsicum annuum]|nr:hypothetical protein FXO37_01822 [Capsicum annuum]